MFSRDERLLLALSGGKDSATLLLALKQLEYNFDALFVNLGIDNFSDASEKTVREICERENIKLHVVYAKQEKQLEIGALPEKYFGKECNVCGTLKRQLFNNFSLEHGYDVLLVAHNMDDEASMLFSNNRKWDYNYLRKSFPVMPAKNGFVKRAKPLCLVRESETKAFAEEQELNIVEKTCPFSSETSRRKYEQIFAHAETLLPGFLEQYYINFLHNFSSLAFLPEEEVTLNECEQCGEFTPARLCRLCAVKEGSWRTQK